MSLPSISPAATPIVIGSANTSIVTPAKETPAFAKPKIGKPSKGDAPYSAYTTSAICNSAMTVIAPMVRM